MYFVNTQNVIGTRCFNKDSSEKKFLSRWWWFPFIYGVDQIFKFLFKFTLFWCTDTCMSVDKGQLRTIPFSLVLSMKTLEARDTDVNILHCTPGNPTRDNQWSTKTNRVIELDIAQITVHNLKIKYDFNKLFDRNLEFGYYKIR